MYTSYDVINGIYVFTVEQSGRFFLKLNGNVGSGTPDLYKNGQKLPFSPFGTISVASNSVGIQSVTPEHEGTYTIRSSNGDELTFRLKVIGMELYLVPQHFKYHNCGAKTNLRGPF